MDDKEYILDKKIVEDDSDMAIITYIEITPQEDIRPGCSTWPQLKSESDYYDDMDGGLDARPENKKSKSTTGKVIYY